MTTGIRTLLKFNLKYYRRHAVLAILCTMGICLGVGIIVAVELINSSALASFASSVEFLGGKATHSIISGYGRVDEKLFASIWKHPSVQVASPVIDVMATSLETGDESIRFLGIDPFLDGELRSFTPSQGGTEPSAFIEFLSGPVPGIYLTGAVMDKFNLHEGNTITVLTAGLEKKVKILGRIPGANEGLLTENLAIMDISAAQDVFGKTGYLDRIDIILKGDAEKFRADLPDALRLTDASTQKSTLTAMLYSFQLNLAAMSLLALFVGTFLIYNFSMFSVLSRREDMSLLLTLGTDNRGLVAAFLLESILLGAVGSVLGILFGYAIAWWSIAKVSSTITDLYFYIQTAKIELTLHIALIGIAVGFLATLIGTGLPALEVAFTPPILGLKRQSIEDRAHNLKRVLFVLGLLCFLLSLASAWASRFSIFWGFASAFAMTLAFALFTPGILSPLCHILGTWLRKGFRSLEGFLAARTIRASLSRTSISVAALAVALSMTVGVDTMIYSFRNSVDAWLEGSLQGDLYISPATTKWDHPLPEKLMEDLAKNPQIQDVERYSTHEVYLEGKPVRLRIVDAAVLERHSRFVFLRGKEDPWTALKKGAVFISEPLSFRFNLKPGDTVDLQTPEGSRSFPIASVVRDYSSDQGTLHIDRIVYEQIWRDPRVQSVAIFMKPGVSPEPVRRSIINDFPGLDRTIVSNTKMKENVLVIFDKTFAPTATLKGVSLMVALLGVATALMAILLERSREIAVLGYLGLTPGETSKMNVYQALIMGLAAYLISVVCGIILTFIIVYAINYRSFGWSIDIYVNPWVFARTFVLTGIACVIASLYPSIKLSRTPVAGIVSDE
ncbi:FtsX-like permease family protein [Desulfomonile tiedjei]|uniref:ABC-type transport system, involved in lipoprotein release, permease component n=1 Tax=Desulfomonile tiedjei (strain ATCC 49306 / DSM 6799 / DCB-1) TaxID=706587 RepID=I4CF74_DESTA|nr:FtsX-like permease family protein [Desulfomonile tiedjei]AFM28215.1 ABC-type transport system, involved in lipoprotein release, permease component [Desulfomonile tiedjei DSM 6799]